VSEQDQVRPDLGGWLSGMCLDRPINVPYGMTPEDATALFYLRRIWGDRYGISYSGDEWKAYRVGTCARVTVTASTAAGLRNAIGEDYRVWQIEIRKRA